MYLELIQQFMHSNAFQLTISAFVLLLYFIVDRYSAPKIEDSLNKGGFKESSSDRAKAMMRTLTAFVGLVSLIFIWGIELGSVLVFAGTTLTLLGVALFASWSILSNITAYFVLLFHPAFKRGTFVRVIDADNYAEGYIADVTLFNTKLISENRETIVYPNNLLLGRPTMINPRDRFEGVGKLRAPQIEPQNPE